MTQLEHSSNGTFSHVMFLGTDVATLFFYHPDDLKHRANNPIDWYSNSFAISKEFEAGRIIAFSTGGDGRFSVRVTDRDLTRREQCYARGTVEFRLRIKMGDFSSTIPMDSPVMNKCPTHLTMKKDG